MTPRTLLLALLLCSAPGFGALVGCSSSGDDDASSTDDESELRRKKDAGARTDAAPAPSGSCALAPAITPTWVAGAAGRPNGPMIFDSVRGQLIVFTATGTSRLGASGWSAPAGDPVPAGAHDETSFAFDSDRGRVVLFGGGDYSALIGDTWEWDGAANTWTKMTPPGFTPRARRGHALVYDAARRQTVLFGGLAGNTSADQMEDTWTWNGSAWTRVGTPAQTHPESRYGARMAFDGARGRVVLYGQYGGWFLGPINGENTSKGNTWEWDGSAWTKMVHGDGAFTSDDPTSLPMAYDTQRGRVVRFGIEGSRYQKTFNVFEWDGNAWRKTSVSTGPRVDIASATQYYGAYDSKRSRMVLGTTAYDWKTQEFFFYEEPNRAPVLATVVNHTVFAGDRLSLSLAATDADGSPIRYDVSPLPSGASFDSQRGAFVWVPTLADVGTHTLTAKATDGCAEDKRTFTVRVDNFDYAGLPSGALKLGGTVTVPIALYQPSRTFEAQLALACVVSGQNPGKVAVTCSGRTTQGYAYGGYTTSFTPTALTASLDQSLAFSFRDGKNDTLRSLAGRLESLSDGTYKLHITAWAQPLTATGPHAVMRTDPPYGTTDAYGIVDVVP